MMTKEAKKKIMKIARSVQKEIRLLKKLETYVYNNLEGKTYTKSIYEAIKNTRSERYTYLKNLLQSLK
ncbi:MAG: hypothetical protein AABX11_02760 [Nanoarchaeota archaeon]